MGCNVIFLVLFKIQPLYTRVLFVYVSNKSMVFSEMQNILLSKLLLFDKWKSRFDIFLLYICMWNFEILCKKWKHSLVLIWNLPGLQTCMASWALEGYRVKRVNFPSRSFHLKWTYDWSWNIWMAFWVGKAWILNTYLIGKKFKCLWVAWEGMLKLRFDWYFVISINISHF